MSEIISRSFLDVDIDNLKKNTKFVEDFNKLYPEFDLEQIENELLIDIILTMNKENLINIPINKSIENIKKNEIYLDDKINEVIQDVEIFDKNNYIKENNIMLNKIRANEVIPELLISNNVIITTGEINGYKINVLFDTGASGCCIVKETISKCKLTELVDNKHILTMQGLVKKNNEGKIWYLDLDLLCMNNTLEKYPISCEVIDKINDKIDLILGSNFLRRYNSIIDFSSRMITLDNYIDNMNQYTLKKNIISFK